MTPQELARRVVDSMYSNDGFSAWLGIRVVDIAPGRAVLGMRVRKEMLNGFGSCHGGIAYSLADSAFAFASNSHGRVSVALDTSISYPAPVAEGDELKAVAEELSLGNRVGFYRVTVVNQDNITVALFQGSVYRTGKKFFEDAA